MRIPWLFHRIFVHYVCLQVFFRALNRQPWDEGIEVTILEDIAGIRSGCFVLFKKMTRSNVRAFTDPVHGTIRLSPVETSIVRSQAFRRLAKIRHLGLAYQVYTSASFSRLTHSLGAYHIAQTITDHLGAILQDDTLHERDLLTFRLGALLHDVGHLPFSHILESASADGAIPQGKSPAHHEAIGALVLQQDERILEALAAIDVKPEEVSNVFRRKDRRHQLANLLSADFDVDRLDYMMRTAHATGLPYGQVDINYLITQIRYKPSGKQKLFLTRKALRPAEHFLLGRFFDYQQVAFHKTVKGLEVILKELAVELHKSGQIDLSNEGLEAMIQQGKWWDFDDDFVMGLIKEAFYNSEDDILRLKANCLIHRQPPCLLASMEVIDQRTRAHAFKLQVKKCDDEIARIAESHGLSGRLLTWSTKLDITKTMPRDPVGEALDTQKDKVDQLIYIENNLDGNSSSFDTIDLSQIKNSLIYYLAAHSWFCYRVYGVDMTHDSNKEVTAELKVALTDVFGEGVR